MYIEGGIILLNVERRTVMFNMFYNLHQSTDRTAVRDIIELVESLTVVSVGCIPGIFVIELLTLENTRKLCSKFEQAKKRKMKRFLQRGAFKIVLEDEVPDGANILGGWYVLTMTLEGTKARSI